MSLQSVTEYLKPFGYDKKIIVLNESSATVALAAEALGCEPCHIAKSLSFMVGERPIMIVVAGDARIDNHKYKEFFGKKAKMMTPEQVVELTGHVVGGVCPFGNKDGVDVYLDVTLKKYDKVFPACGSRNSAIELSVDEFEKLSGYKCWVDVCKEPQQEN